LVKAEQALLTLNTRLNTRNLKEEQAIKLHITAILKKHGVNELIQIQYGTSIETERVQISKGRPGKNTQYKIVTRSIHTLTWSRDRKEIKKEANTDGVFSLLSTDTALSTKEVLQAYKYQPRLEKRFSQFKSYHRAAPYYFKSISRIESNLFVFFIALVIQALIEREVRSKMREEGIRALLIYPEKREAEQPTTNKIIDLFEAVSTYSIYEGDCIVEEFRDELSDTQKTILKYLDINESDYWG
jgi:transposase